MQNPSPGLQVFQAPLPYAETDPDFHLCPLPRTKNDNRKRIGLDEKVRVQCLFLVIEAIEVKMGHVMTGHDPRHDAMEEVPVSGSDVTR